MTHPPVRWVAGSFFLKKKRLRHEAERSPSPRAEVMNEWIYTTIPTLCHHAEYRYKIISASFALINISNSKADENKSTGEKYSCIRLKTGRMNPKEETTKSCHYDLTLLHALCREGGVSGRYAAKMSALRCEMP
jgi:hypothetical protein